MKSLADYEGGSWPPIGWHVATVTKYEMTESAEKRTPGVEFSFQVGERIATRTFYLTEKALVFLGYFAADCGLTQEQRRQYDVDNSTSHRILINRRVQIRVAKQVSDDRYHEVVEFAKIGENVTNTPADPRVDRSAEVADISADELEKTPF